MAVEVLVEARAELGEGPVWDPWLDRLLWVNINAGEIHATSENGVDEIVYHHSHSIGFVWPTGPSRHIIGRRHDVVRTTGFDEPEERLSIPSLVQSQRINDGAMSRSGVVVFGTLDESTELPDNRLYGFSETESSLATTHLSVLAPTVQLSNGVGWSTNETEMYFVDTPTRRLDVFDFDAGSITVANRRTLCDFPASYGLPDGITVDDDGAIWVAFWGGEAVRKFSPSGALLETISLPATNPTSCTLGPNGDLFVTSARTESANGRHDGSIFVIAAG